MHHSAAVRFLQPFANLGPNAEHLVKRQAALAQAFTEGFTLQILHDDVAGAILLSDVVKVADVGMAQRRDGAGFPVEALASLGIFGKMGGENLYGYGAVQARVAGAVHLAHAACAERRDNLVRTELLTRGKPHALGVIIACAARCRGCEDPGCVVASLDRKRLGADCWGGVGCRTEAFSIRRLGGSRWCLRRTRCAMGFERQRGSERGLGRAAKRGGDAARNVGMVWKMSQSVCGE